jgi:hypothetical protein
MRFRDIEMLHQRPKWYHIRNQSASLGQQILGRIMVGWSLIPFNDADKVPVPPNPNTYLRPTFQRVKLQMFIIGIRSIFTADEKLENVKVMISFSESESGTMTALCKIKNSGCSFNSLLHVEILVPENVNLTSFMEIKLLS